MTITAKELAIELLKQLDSFEEEYGNGASYSNLQFGYAFATACVQQIFNKLDTMKNVNVDNLNNEFIKF